MARKLEPDRESLADRLMTSAATYARHSVAAVISLETARVPSRICKSQARICARSFKDLQKPGKDLRAFLTWSAQLFGEKLQLLQEILKFLAEKSGCLSRQAR